MNLLVVTMSLWNSKETDLETRSVSGQPRTPSKWTQGQMKQCEEDQENYCVRQQLNLDQKKELWRHESVKRAPNVNSWCPSNISVKIVNKDFTDSELGPNYNRQIFYTAEDRETRRAIADERMKPRSHDIDMSLPAQRMREYKLVSKDNRPTIMPPPDITEDKVYSWWQRLTLDRSVILPDTHMQTNLVDFMAGWADRNPVQGETLFNRLIQLAKKHNWTRSIFGPARPATAVRSVEPQQYEPMRPPSPIQIPLDPVDKLEPPRPILIAKPKVQTKRTPRPRIIPLDARPRTPIEPFISRVKTMPAKVQGQIPKKKYGSSVPTSDKITEAPVAPVTSPTPGTSSTVGEPTKKSGLKLLSESFKRKRHHKYSKEKSLKDQAKSARRRPFELLDELFNSQLTAPFEDEVPEVLPTLQLTLRTPAVDQPLLDPNDTVASAPVEVPMPRQDSPASSSPMNVETRPTSPVNTETRPTARVTPVQLPLDDYRPTATAVPEVITITHQTTPSSLIRQYPALRMNAVCNSMIEISAPNSDPARNQTIQYSTRPGTFWCEDEDLVESMRWYTQNTLVIGEIPRSPSSDEEEPMEEDFEIRNQE